MDDGDLVVVLERLVRHEVTAADQAAVPVRLEDATDTPHAERRQLGRPERTHAGGPEDVDALADRPEDLLVPDRGYPLEVAVDDAERPGPQPRDGAVDVAQLHRWKDGDVEDPRCVRDGEGRPEEDADAHGVTPSNWWARRPGV